VTQREDPQLTAAQAPPGPRTMALVAGAAGLSILLVAYWVRTWQSLAVVRRICPVWFCDFVDYYYPMGEAVFRTGLPVDGFLYSPFIAILMAALPPLGLSASLVIWGILEVLFVALYVLIFRRLVPAGLPIQLLFAVLTVFSYPLVLNLMGGQVSLFIVVPLLAGLVLYERGERVAAAGLGALAVSFKFYPVLFIAPFIGRRDARFVALAAAAFVTVLFVVPGIFLGAGHTLGFYGALIDAFRDSGWVVINRHSQFFPHVMLRPFEAALEDPGFPLALLRWISYGIAAANLGLVVLVQRARLRHADLWSFQIVFMTIPFVLKTSWLHDFAFLPFTQAFMAWQLLQSDGAWRERAPFVRQAVTFSLILSIALSNIFFFSLFGFMNYAILAILFWASLLLLIASYVTLLPPALRSARVSP
jgi:hypothetical protein